MHSKLIILALCSLFCATPLLAADKVIATVDGNKITQAMLDVYALQRGAPSSSDVDQEQRDKLLQELINREILYQKAMAGKMEKNAQVQLELDSARRNILASQVIRNLAEGDKELTDEFLTAEYNKYIATLSNTEFKARHILVDSEEGAKSIVAELDKGTDFIKLAEEKSDGPSKSAGGDLGWFRSEQMVKPFSDAVAKLEKGKYTKTPIKTEFGWHVILLEDTRTISPPPFSAIKDQLAQKIRTERITNFLADVRKTAKIDIAK